MKPWPESFDESPFSSEFMLKTTERIEKLHSRGSPEKRISPRFAPSQTRSNQPGCDEEVSHIWARELEPTSEVAFPCEAEVPTSSEEEASEKLDEQTNDIEIEQFAISRTPAAKKVAIASIATAAYLAATSEAVHEEITQRAAQRAGYGERLDSRLQEGCRWPDVPCSKRVGKQDMPDDDNVKTSYEDFAKYLARSKFHWSIKPDNVPYRSHQGDLQIWHSMSPMKGETNGQVRRKIFAQIKLWYEKALRDPKKGLFHIGKALHTIQDSYANSHTWRARDGRVLSFQDYNFQDEHKHREDDKISSPGVNKAIEVSAKLLSLHRRKAPFDPGVKALLDEVYQMWPGYDLWPAGIPSQRYITGKEARKIQDFFKGSTAWPKDFVQYLLEYVYKQVESTGEYSEQESYGSPWRDGAEASARVEENEDVSEEWEEETNEFREDSISESQDEGQS